MAENGNGNGRYKAQNFIDAIPGSGGIITTIASRVGCAWHTAKKYIVEYATVQAAYDDECAKVVDLAESVIIGSIKDKDVQTAKWFLTMKGAERGYMQVQRQEVSGPGGGPMEATVRVNVGQLTDDELAALASIAGRIATDTAGEGEA